MYPKAWDIYTFCAQTSILGFEQSGVGLVSLYYKKNEFENYDNEYKSFSKNDRSLRANIVLLIMLYTRNVQDFLKSYVVEFKMYFFISWCFLSVSSSRSKYEIPTQKQQYCSHSRHKNIPFMSSNCDFCYFWPFIDFNINQNLGMYFMAF